MGSKNIKFKKNRKLCIQGNLNPEILLKTKEDILMHVKNIMNSFESINHVFNLGHGVIKTSSIENVKFLIVQLKIGKNEKVAIILFNLGGQIN